MRFYTRLVSRLELCRSFMGLGLCECVVKSLFVITSLESGPAIRILQTLDKLPLKNVLFYAR